LSAPPPVDAAPPPPQTSLAKRLERLAARRVEALLDEADALPPAASSPERLAELDTLAALIGLRDRLDPQPSRKRWPAVAAFVLTMGVVSALLFVHVRQTEVELDATVSELTFSLARPQAVTEPLVVRFIGIAGFETVAGLESGVAAPGRLAIAAAAADAACTGSLTLDRLILPRGARVNVLRPALPQRAHLRVIAPGATLRLTLDGCVRKGGAAGAASTARAMRTVDVSLGRDEVDIDLEPAAAAGFGLAPFVRIDELSLSRVEEIAGDGETLVRRVSTIDAGTVLLDDLDGQARPLRAAEPLRLERVDGELRSVAFEAKLIALRFHGDVHGMGSGSDTHLRSWMPTWLDWLKSNHAASLFWTAVTSGFGLLLALLKWWRPAQRTGAD
jgi:hypothetical protein